MRLPQSILSVTVALGRQAACILLLLACAAAQAEETHTTNAVIDWRELPKLPVGVSGAFVGTSADRLIVAGGARFSTSPFEGGEKTWERDIWSLDPSSTSWELTGRLPSPMAYGMSAVVGDRTICVGGTNGEACSDLAFSMQWTGGEVKLTPLPPLPQPLAFGAAAAIDNVVYVFGGRQTQDAAAASNALWALDLNAGAGEANWIKLPPCPGPGRILPAMVAQHDGFHPVLIVAGGCELLPDGDGVAKRRYLSDAWSFDPTESAENAWRRLADMPRPSAGAPAAPAGQSHVLIFGGDDGRDFPRIDELADDHQGFRHDTLIYHTITDTWTTGADLPAALVTTSAVRWNERLVIAGGEDRPGHRDAAVWSGELVGRKPQFGLGNYIVLSVYLAMLIGIGVYFSRRTHTTEDFFLGGRRIPWWAAGLSIFGTQLSAITFMAFPAKSYAQNWVFFIANLCILAVVPIVVYFYIPFYRRLNITTAYEYLERRFNLPLRLFGSAIFVLFQLGRMGIVVFLPAIALSAATGLDVYVCILLMGVICTIYTFLGGIEAVIWTDVLQVVVLTGGALLVLGVIVSSLDEGAGSIVTSLWDSGKLRAINWTWDYTVASLWVVVLGNECINMYPLTADQTVVQRYLTTRDEKQAARSLWVNGALVLPASLLFFGLGSALYVYYREHPALLDPTMHTDGILPWFVATELPVGLGGLVIAGVFAAAQSSLSSSLNSAVTAIVSDFYNRLTGNTNDRRALRLGRWLTVALGVIGTGTALGIAHYGFKSMVDTYSIIIGMFGAGLAGVFALGVFSRRAHGAGAMIGAVVGTAVLFCVRVFTNAHFFVYAIVGFACCLAVGYVASLILPGRIPELDGLTVQSLRRRKPQYSDGATGMAADRSSAVQVAGEQP